MPLLNYVENSYLKYKQIGYSNRYLKEGISHFSGKLSAGSPGTSFDFFINCIIKNRSTSKIREGSSKIHNISARCIFMLFQERLKFLLRSSGTYIWKSFAPAPHS